MLDEKSDLHKKMLAATESWRALLQDIGPDEHAAVFMMAIFPDKSATIQAMVSDEKLSNMFANTIARADCDERAYGMAVAIVGGVEAGLKHRKAEKKAGEN